jgi:hypothetical protein
VTLVHTALTMDYEPSRREQRREQALREDAGQCAVATVVECRRRWGFSESGRDGLKMGKVQHYTLRVRVQPEGAPAFEAELKEKQYFSRAADMPKPGDRLPVLYDPAEPSEVARDTSLDAAVAMRAQS